MVSKNALLLPTVLIGDMPIPDICTRRLDELERVFHIANLTALIYGNEDDSLWFSYLSEMMGHCYQDRIEKERIGGKNIFTLRKDVGA